MQEIMIVDDEENILKALKRTLATKKQWNVEIYNSAEKGLERAMEKNFDLFLSDYRMPQIDGITFLTGVKMLQPDAMRIILSGNTELDALMSAINKVEIFRFITKPWEDEILFSSIEQALDYKKTLLENKILADQVRKQHKELDKQKKVMEEYKNLHPDLLAVEFSDDGTIILDDNPFNN